MGSGDEGGRASRWTTARAESGAPSAADDPGVDDVEARTSAAARAFAALGLSGGSADGSVADPGVAADVGGGESAPLRPDAVLRGRRFAVPPADPRDLSDEAQRLADDRRRAERRRLAEERRQSEREAVATPPPPADAPAERAAAPTRAAPPPARRRDRALLHLTALAAASGALVAPVTWSLAVALGALAGVTIRSVVDHGPDLGGLIGRGARRAAGWLRPRSLVWLPVLAARTVIIAVVVPATVWAIGWVVAEGTDGALVAARAGMWADGFRTAAAIVCFMLVAGIGDARHRRAALLRRAVGDPTTAAVVAGVAGAVVLVAVLVVPRAGAGPISGLDGLAWVPGPLRGTVDRARDSVVRAELQEVTDCLSSRQDLSWRAIYTSANPVASDDVARLATRTGDPSAAEVATAAAALHDMLAPWVDTIVIEAGDVTLAEIDRGEIRADRPLADGSGLPSAAVSGRDLVDQGAGDLDRATARACASAITP